MGERVGTPGETDDHFLFMGHTFLSTSLWAGNSSPEFHGFPHPLFGNG